MLRRWFGHALLATVGACAHSPQTDHAIEVPVSPPAAVAEDDVAPEAPAEPATDPASDSEPETDAARDQDPGVGDPAEALPESPVPNAESFVLEQSEDWERSSGRGLGTMPYPPTEAEAPFHERVYGNAPFTLAGYEELPREVGSFGGWFGVVRGYRKLPEQGETRLLCESKYFDGLTDTHILCLSFNGGGDFVAVLPGTGHRIQPLGLVRVYGEITSAKDDVPRVRAVYVRHFQWGQFCFMNLHGKPAGNQTWRERFCKVEVTDPSSVYDPFPDEDYYRDLLGDPAAFRSGEVEVEVPAD